MGMLITRSCDYDGCQEAESLTCDHDGYVREYDDEGELTEETPFEVIGDILWCDYDSRGYPKGRYLCRAHERAARLEQGIHLLA